MATSRLSRRRRSQLPFRHLCELGGQGAGGRRQCSAPPRGGVPPHPAPAFARARQEPPERDPAGALRSVGGGGPRGLPSALSLAACGGKGPGPPSGRLAAALQQLAHGAGLRDGVAGARGRYSEHEGRLPDVCGPGAGWGKSAGRTEAGSPGGGGEGGGAAVGKAAWLGGRVGTGYPQTGGRGGAPAAAPPL